jgi:hypothetical protein
MTTLSQRLADYLAARRSLGNDLTFSGRVLRGFASREEARTEIFDYIEVFYNRQLAQATLRFLSPVEFENLSRVALQNCPGNPG